MSYEEDKLERLKDSEYEKAYIEALKSFDKICQRTLHSRFRDFWRIWYKVMPAKWTGL